MNSEPEKKEYPVCRTCGSADVSVDATARWCIETNKWELSATHDSGYCDACDGESKRFDWILDTDGVES